ncbi:MAG TPA: hypothetical protein VGN52_08765 [Burkholderiales bacterium]|jgi:hypothetical protein
MTPSDSQSSREIIADLQARVHYLEGALAVALRARDGVETPAMRLALNAAARSLPSELFSLSAEPVRPVPAKKPDLMSFTNSFATLDARLQEQAACEQAVRPAPADLGLPAMLDAEMIDRAAPKPLPELIHVTSPLEDGYPHLLAKISAIWGEPECIPYLRKLIVDDRGSRQGFPFEVMSELLVLSAVAETPADKSAWMMRAAA